jgi:hypothetical protein
MPKLLSLATGFLISAIVLPCSFSTAQDTPTYRAGLKSLAIPAPSSELVETGSDYRVLFENLAPTTNRLIAVFIEAPDLDSIRSQGSTALNRYALVEVPRRAEFANVTTDLFKEIANSLASQLGVKVDESIKDQQDEINRRLKALGSNLAEVTLEKPVQLGTLFSKPDACAYGMIMAISSGGKTKKMMIGVTAVRVQTRVLLIYTYNEYKDESSVQWIRTTDEHWADAILAANQ